MHVNLYAPKSIDGGRFEKLLAFWDDVKNPISLFEELLKTGIDIRLKCPDDYWSIYERVSDRKYKEEVLDLLKQYRPELYYEIMLGIKQ